MWFGSTTHVLSLLPKFRACALCQNQDFFQEILLSARLFYTDFACSTYNNELPTLAHIGCSSYAAVMSIHIYLWYYNLRRFSPQKKYNRKYLGSDSKTSGLASIKLFLNNLQKKISLFKLFSADPSFIYSWSIGHILEHEFFYLGRLGSQGSKGKKVDLRNLEQLLRVDSTGPNVLLS